jgi:amino acid efflux transporter
VVGWCFYFAIPLGAPPACAFAGGYVADVLGGGETTRIATFLVIVGSVFVMNWFGLRVSGRVQLVLTGVLATLLLVTVIAALPHAHRANLHPFAPHGWSGIGAAAAILVWGFAGWEAVSSLSAEYRDPRRDVPRATGIAVVVVGGLYLAVATTSVLVLGPALADSPAPLADLLATGFGGPVRIITAIVAVLLTVGAVNAYLAGGSRLGAALARDGALPKVLTGTPRRSLCLIGAGSLIAVALPLSTNAALLLVTGCFTLVYVLGTAAAVRLLPAGWSRVSAGVAFLATLALLVLNGKPALFSLAVGAGALVYQTQARSRRAKIASPSSSSAGSIAPNPNTKPACLTE